MTLVVRPTAPDEYQAAGAVVARALMLPPWTDEEFARRAATFEESISFSAWDGERCVGHAAQFLVDTLVPGGAGVPTGAVSRVGVLPSHRRRGLATRLMTALIDDAVARGLVLMSLRASETLIYRRFGFGLAGDVVGVTVLRDRARPLDGRPVGGSFRLLTVDEAREEIPGIYARVAHRVGTVTRPACWWPRLLEPTSGRADFVAVHDDEHGVADGYVRFDTTWDDAHPDGPTGHGRVHDLFGANDAVEIALWRFVLDVDLVSRWTADQRPLDDPVREAMRDPRAFRVTSLDDEQWLRIVDVDAALAARSFRGVAGSVVLAIDDPMVPANTGHWRVAADGATRTDEPAVITAGVEALAAAYLGGRSWSTLVAGGRAAASDVAAVAAADELFGTPRSPFCGTFF